jgi:hypothetical protein
MDRTLKEGSTEYASSPKVHEASTLDSVPDGASPSDTKTLQQGENPSGNDNMVMDCESNDIFGDLN